MPNAETNLPGVETVLSAVEAALAVLPPSIIELGESMDNARRQSMVALGYPNSEAARDLGNLLAQAEDNLCNAEVALQVARDALATYLGGLRQYEAGAPGEVIDRERHEREPSAFKGRLDECVRYLQAHEYIDRDLKEEICNMQVELLTLTGLPAGLADSISEGLSSRYRTLFKDEPELLIIDEDESVEPADWQAALMRIDAHVRMMGVQRFVRVCETAGYACPDRYTTEQLMRMSRLIEGEAPLPEGDITLVLTDAYGDQSNTLGDQIPEYENHKGNVFYAEVQQFSDLYRVPVILARRYGLRASTLVIAAHGSRGQVVVGGGEGVALGPAPPLCNGFYSLQNTAVGRFVHDYMVPSRGTGERTIIVSACEQAKPDGPGGQSVIEALALQTDPADNVAVSGAFARETSVQRLNMGDPDDRWLMESDVYDVHGLPAKDGEIVLFWDVVEDEPAAACTCRNTPEGLRRTRHWTLPGVS